MSINEPGTSQRYLNPLDIHVLPGYSIEVFAQGLNTPVSLAFDNDGNIIIGESGIIDGNPRVERLNRDGTYELVAEGFNFPLTGICYHEGDIYVSHAGVVTVIRDDGTRSDLITGLPSIGDYKNYQIIFGPDGKMYFGQGAATNSGVVGLDNLWAAERPFFHDLVAEDIILVGQNFITPNFLTYNPTDYAFTGAFRPFGTPNKPNTIIPANLRPTSCIFRAEPDGSHLEVYAWGIRNPVRVKFDRFGRLYVANRGFDNRGSRPVNNSPDEFLHVSQGEWYGFPDYTAGEPVTDPRFRPDIGPQPEFLLASHPTIPTRPLSIFEPHSSVSGFDFNYNPEFGPYGDVYLAEFGSSMPTTTGGYPLPGVGRRIVRIDMNTGSVSTFAINKTGLAASLLGGGGFERPVDAEFGPDGAMYILDYGMADPVNPAFPYIPNTGVIWRIKRL